MYLYVCVCLYFDVEEKKGTTTTKKKAYDTACSQAVTHPSTNAAQCCLTSVIGRELVFSTWYGRRQGIGENIISMPCVSRSQPEKIIAIEIEICR